MHENKQNNETSQKKRHIFTASANDQVQTEKILSAPMEMGKDFNKQFNFIISLMIL